MTICTVEGCENPARSRQWCAMHYLRWYRQGDPLKVIDARRASVTHGMRNSRTYASWCSMIQRCTNTTRPTWRDYGGRGITVCERWRASFEDFLADMGERPEGLTLDRIDNDGNYEPGNCRWTTMSEQQRNKRPMSDETREKRRQQALAQHGKRRSLVKATN